MYYIYGHMYVNILFIYMNVCKYTYVNILFILYEIYYFRRLTKVVEKLSAVVPNLTGSFTHPRCWHPEV